MPLLYCATLVLSAGLMFIVEPMFAKMVLSLLGGSPSVWNTCLVFYQAALMLGYIYAHLSLKYLGPRRQAVLHLAFLCLPWLVLPIALAKGWTPHGDENPIPWLLMLLTVAVGLPFVCVASSAPVIQAWYAVSGRRLAGDPYFLYAASNVGSLVGLAAYPLFIEPRWNLAAQSWGWMIGYGVMTVLCALCALSLWFSIANGTASDAALGHASPATALEHENDRPITAARRLWWLVLSLVPSSLLMGVTTYVTVDITPRPLLWVIPLGLYLLSFVVVFARWRLLQWLWLIRAVQALLLVATAALFYSTGVQTDDIFGRAALHLVTFFVTSLACHGALAADRPASRNLTEYYLWMSAGGVLGGLLCALIAPLVFKSYLEYPLMLVAACVLRPTFTFNRWERLWQRLDVPLLLALASIFAFVAIGLEGNRFVKLVASFKSAAAAQGGQTTSLNSMAGWLAGSSGKMCLIACAAVVALLMQRRREMFAVAVATLLVISAICSYKSNSIYSTRSFFGVLRVEMTSYSKDGAELPGHRLMHGSTMHGAQSLDPVEAHEPWSFYHRKGPVGDAIGVLEARPEFIEHGTIGVVGLGAGSIAAYGHSGQYLTYFEIDPAVQRIAENPHYFTYLTDCSAKWNVCLGDARLTLAATPDSRFDVLFIDAFSSDAIPVHLITREAVEMYFRKLRPHGLLMVHMSNRHLNLQPVLSASAVPMSLASRVRVDSAVKSHDKSTSTWGDSARVEDDLHSPSVWGVLARSEDDLGALRSDARWKSLEIDPNFPPWTDDYSSIVSAMSGGWFSSGKK